ncbi:hypothetical protein JTE90_018847 [Oedothorax gibbosus]|uniref:Uncharacterized protein n=1 Tax=Oedothorax gibbosus TaxID=931172 RepID=A0AAV6UXQ4_9ARAC|nr:hypothetical protein JTE90_018847 [Oedothorax gibbosus]
MFRVLKIRKSTVAFSPTATRERRWKTTTSQPPTQAQCGVIAPANPFSCCRGRKKKKEAQDEAMERDVVRVWGRDSLFFSLLWPREDDKPLNSGTGPGTKEGIQMIGQVVHRWDQGAFVGCITIGQSSEE